MASGSRECGRVLINIVGNRLLLLVLFVALALIGGSLADLLGLHQHRHVLYDVLGLPVGLAALVAVWFAYFS
jgi:hypothetical protein